MAQPRGKRITKMMLASGGEKSLTALALLFAVYSVPFRSTPDEVEAALDDANLSKLLDAIEQPSIHSVDCHFHQRHHGAGRCTVWCIHAGRWCQLMLSLRGLIRQTGKVADI